MEKKIKEVQDYFRAKILAKEFETKEITEYVYTILVDGKFEFSIWVGNLDIIESVKLYGSKKNTIWIEFNNDEREQLKSLLLPDIIQYKREKLESERQQRIDKLKAELDKLEQNT